MQVFKKAVLFILVNLLVLSAMQFALGAPSDYERQVAAFQDGEYTSVIIGTSYGRNLVSEYLPDGEKVYDLSRPRVPLTDFSYIVKELNKHQKLDRVYYDISVPYWNGELGEINRVDMMRILSGKERLQYLFKVLTQENYNDFFFRYELEALSVMAIPSNVKTKLAMLFHREDLLPESGGPLSVANADTTSFFFSPDQIEPRSLEAFDDLAVYCAENDIELITYINAYPPERILHENQNDIHDYFAALLDSYGLPLYDMNYLKWEYLPRTAEEYSDNDGHMKAPLAERYTRMLTRVLTSEDPSQYFETNYQDVLDGIKTYEEDAA